MIPFTSRKQSYVVSAEGNPTTHSTRPAIAWLSRYFLAASVEWLSRGRINSGVVPLRITTEVEMIVMRQGEEIRRLKVQVQSAAQLSLNPTGWSILFIENLDAALNSSRRVDLGVRRLHFVL
jgi:hypothetical protein